MNDVQKPSDSSPQEVLISILPRWTVVVLCMVAFFFMTGFLVVLVIFPKYFLSLETPFSRFWLCLAVATYFSVFFFVFYPQRIVLESFPKFDMPTRVVGPVALCLFLLWILVEMCPQPVVGVLHEVRYASGLEAVDLRTIRVRTEDSRYKLYALASDDKVSFGGLYIQYPPGEIECVVSIDVDLYKPFKVVLNRSAGDKSFAFNPDPMESKKP